MESRAVPTCLGGCRAPLGVASAVVPVAPRSTRLRCATGSPAFDDTRPRTITLDARRPSVALVPREVRERKLLGGNVGMRPSDLGKLLRCGALVAGGGSRGSLEASRWRDAGDGHAGPETQRW